MTATDELRAELTKRGVKWTSERVANGVLFTFVKDGRTYSVFVRDRAGLEIWSKYLTPKQAIAATLGSGMCKLVETEHEQEIADEFGKGTFSYWAYDCSECGYENAQHGRFCAGCGRKVVDE